MIPLKIHWPKSKFPLITAMLIAVNTTIFLFTYNTKGFEAIVEKFAFKLGPTAFWSWFTSLFLHADWVHLIGNMVFLYVFGSLLENVLSRHKYIVLYLFGGLVAAMVQGLVFLTISADKISEFSVIGASGAIFALLGVVMVRFRQNKVTWYVITPLFLIELLLIPSGFAGPLGSILGIIIFMFILSYGFNNDIPAYQLVTVWPAFTITALATGVSYLVLQLGFGFLQIAKGEIAGVAYWAHTGGIIGGLIMVRVYGIGADALREYMAQDGASLFRQGRYKEAASKYDELLEKGVPDNYFIRKAARAWALAGNVAKSAAYFKRAFDAYYSKGMKEEASQVYDDIQNYVPSHSFDIQTELKLSSLCQTQYKLEAAMRGYQKIVTKWPDSQEAELADLRIAQVYEKMGNKKVAADRYSNFIKKHPASRWSGLAKQWLKKDKIKPA